MNNTPQEHAIISMLSDVPADINSDIYKHYEKTLPIFPNQAIYIYSFKEQKMIYAKGWKDVLGYEDSEITMHKYINSTIPKYMDQTNEFNQKGLEFVNSKKENIDQYSFSREVQVYHKNGSIVPIYSRATIHKSENGNITEVLGFTQLMPSLKFGKIMKCAVYGPDTENFESLLNKQLFDSNSFKISKREREALKLMAVGHSYKEAADILCISLSAMEKRIRPLFKRFNVKSLPHLISFSKDNNII